MFYSLCYFSHAVVVYVCVRILDNLPLVVPIERLDQGQGTPSVVYQLGYHVGLKGQYEGVSTFGSFSICTARDSMVF